MTEFETFMAIQTLSSATGMAIMSCFTILSAYLIACFFVGNILTRFQAITLSILYSLFYIPPARTCIKGLIDYLSGSHKFAEQYPNSFFSTSNAPDYFPYMLSFLLFFGWLMSIIYMVYIRKNNDHSDGTYQSLKNNQEQSST